MSTYNIPSKVLLLASAALILSALMQLGTTWLQFQVQNMSVLSPPDAGRKYTWIDDDFPNALPLELESVALTIENSRHYALDTPDAEAEYKSIYPGEHLGFIRLGPNRRFFGVSMYHQLHCLDSLRMAIVHGAEWNHHGREKRDQVPHVDHCLNYLRQTILCSADLTLEPEVVLGSRDVGEGLTVTHVCKDWSKLFDFAEKNAKEWEKWDNITKGI